jgi:mannose-1-phosphate guanylyltransferase
LGGGPDPVVVDSPGALTVSAAGRLVAVLGLPGVVVVDTPGAVLVTTRERAQDVKTLADLHPAAPGDQAGSAASGAARDLNLQANGADRM